MKLRNLGWCSAIAAFVALSCGDAVPPPAEGAATIALFPSKTAPTTYTCETHSITWAGNGLGPNSASTGELLVNGHDGATVSCKVSGDSSYDVKGSIRQNGATFSFSGKVDSNGTGTVRVDFRDQANSTNQTDEACSIQLESGNYEVTSGAIWAGITCSHLVSDFRYRWCAANATVVFKSCSE
ncbi:MAG: hypothetical protein QM784_01635 [Polyangiaceae bacterium]